jgi:hypothetical protein
MIVVAIKNVMDVILIAVVMGVIDATKTPVAYVIRHAISKQEDVSPVIKHVMKKPDSVDVTKLVLKKQGHVHAIKLVINSSHVAHAMDATVM